RSLLPLLLKQACTYSLWFRDSHPQTHVWTREVVKRLEKGRAPFHLFALFTETAAFAHQRRQDMAKGLIDALDQTGADFQSPVASTSLRQRARARSVLSVAPSLSSRLY